jgi:hypothetical protein
MGMLNVPNRTRLGLGSGGIILDGSLHINRSPFAQEFHVMTATQMALVKGDVRDRCFTSVNAALNACVDNRGDKIFLAERYTESITGADQWSNGKIGVQIIGLGENANRPVITWTAAGSTVVLQKAGMKLENLILQMEPTTGTVTVAAPLTVQADGISIVGCRINCGTDANNKVTIAITTTAAATNLVFTGNLVRGAAAATMTTFLRCVGLANPIIAYNDIACGTTAAAVGPIQELTTACTGILIAENYIQNNATSSTACITMGLASTTGWIALNKLRNMTDASNAQIVVTSGDVQLWDNKGVNNSNETAILLGTASV